MPRPRNPLTPSPAERARAWRTDHADTKVRVSSEALAKLDRIAAARGVTRKEVAEQAIMNLLE